MKVDVWRRPGTYIDVGAFDPIKYSNTLLFNQYGWRGINIDPEPERIARFEKSRPSDLNLCVAVGEEAGEQEFLTYSGDGATSRLGSCAGAAKQSLLGEMPVRTRMVKTEKLSALLDKHLRKGAEVELLTVDCEGADLSVLRSNDWTKYRPFVVAVEDDCSTFDTEVVRFCEAQGYGLVAQSVVTRIFGREDLVGRP